MNKIELFLSLGNDTDSYRNLLSALPAGDDNLTRGIVTPSHPANRPLAFTVENVEPGQAYLVQVTSEYETPPMPNFGFVPTSSTYQISMSLAYGPNTIDIKGSNGDYARFTISVTHYALLFRSSAREISEYCKVPLKILSDNLDSSIGYMQALPLVGDLVDLIPADLEVLGTLSYKLIIKNLLHRPGRDIATTELLSAFCVSTPVFNPMHNLGVAETTLYRTEEHFAGYEAHVWMPNREIERWRTFILLVNNLPQLFTLKQVTEGEVYVKIGNKLRRHLFDFNSAFANSIIEGTQLITECFKNLFWLDMTVDSEHFLSYCQASYILDSRIVPPGLLTSDADLLAVSNWAGWSLTGRFEQQYDISHDIHRWKYDSPLDGVVDGDNRYFRPSAIPSSSNATKLFIDGLLLRLAEDYRVSLGSSFRSGSYRTYNSPDPMLLDVNVGDPRTFIAPVFTSLEVAGGADMQYLITVVDQGLESLKFVVSAPPTLDLSSDQVAYLHYMSPAMPAIAYGGGNQYGMAPLPIGTVTYSLTFPTSATSIDYQLLVQYAEDPMASGPSGVSQPTLIVKAHSLTGATVEFSAPIDSPNAQLHWWMIERDGIALERGTLSLTNGQDEQLVQFSEGPYLEPVIVMFQLWTTDALSGAVMPFTSFRYLGSTSCTVRFSSPIEGSFCRLDYLVFASQAGNLIEVFNPPQPGQLVEAHYDTKWQYWRNTGLIPITDGVRRDFTLPFTMANPDSLYLTLNGRLLTQGAENQYVVTSPTTVRLNFSPTPTQRLWAVYPVANGAGEIPESTWHQGFLTRQGDDPGRNAVGEIRHEGKIALGDTVTIRDTTLTAIATAKGTISNPGTIVSGHAVTFASSGVSLTAVPQSASNTSPAIQEIVEVWTTADVGGSLNGKYFFLGRPALPGLYVWFNVGGFGVDPLIPSKIGVQVSLYAGSTAEAVAAEIQSALSLLPYIITLSGNHLVIKNRDGGDVTDASDAGGTGFTVTVTSQGSDPQPIFDQFKVGLGQDIDAASLVSTFNSHPVLSGSYFAEYQGNGLTTIKSLTLTPSVTEVASITSLSDVSGSLAGKYLWVGSDYYVWFMVGGVGTDPSPAGGTNVEVHVATNATAATIASAIRVALIPLGFGVEIDGAVITVSQPTAGIVSHPSAADSGFGITILIPGRNAGTAANQTLTVSGNSMIATSITGDSAPFVGVFAAGVNRENDSWSLERAINSHPDLNFRYYSQVPETGLVTLTSLVRGAEENAEVAVGPSMLSKPLIGGRRTDRDLPMLTYKTFYYHDAPIVALDGASSRLYDSYGGNAVRFQFRPTGQQEPYYVSEVFPIDRHPLDSLNANQDCNYPKGLFTQGLLTTLTDSDVAAPSPGFITITIDGLPVQEEPTGVIDGSNSTFKLTLSSKAGVNSLIVWIDGIFQPPLPSNFSYTEISGQGQIIFVDAPQPGQKLWAWYLPSGDSAIDERVESLVGTIDGSNQHFSIASAPITYRQSILLFLEGLFQLQNVDYSVDPSTLFFDFTPAFPDPNWIAPAIGQSLWCHLNRGVADPKNWRQLRLGVADGATSRFTIPHLIQSELPTSVESVIVALDGLVQRNKIDFNVVVAANPMTVSVTIGTPAVVDLINHGFSEGASVFFQTNGSLPTGLSQNTLYVVRNPLSDSFNVSTTIGGPLIDTSGSQSGVHVVYGAGEYPMGDIIFTNPPEIGRKVDIAFIRRS